MWKTKYLFFFWTNISLISAEFFCDNDGSFWCGNVCFGGFAPSYICSCGEKSFNASIYNNLVCISDANCFIDTSGKIASCPNGTVEEGPFYYSGYCHVESVVRSSVPCMTESEGYICSDIKVDTLFCRGMSFWAQTCDE